MSPNAKIQDRQTGGLLLVQKILNKDFVNGVVVAIPRGGICVGSVVADRLGLPLEVMPCRKVNDPANQAKDIGSVSETETYFHDCPKDVPQDYLYFKSVLLRNEMRHQHDFYYGNDTPLKLEARTVILVDDVVSSPDELTACIREIRYQKPLKIIVLVPFAQTDASNAIRAQVDELVVLAEQKLIKSPLEFYEQFPAVNDWTVRNLLRQSQRKNVEKVPVIK